MVVMVCSSAPPPPPPPPPARGGPVKGALPATSPGRAPAMTAVQTPGVVAEQTRIAEETLQEVEDLLRSIPDADLHRAHPDGGWTGAQIVSHMTLAGLLWVADVQRLVADPDLDLFYREEIGHDVTGAVPPTAAEAA